MIYFDNAAGSWPKPPGTVTAMVDALKETGSSPGRGGHRASLAASRILWRARECVASFFNCPDPSRVIFTHNATYALNQAIKGVLRPGDHVVVSSMEHNSVLRPLFSMGSKGVSHTVVMADPQGTLSAADMLGAFKENTRLVVITHASNVTGTVMPVAEIVASARRAGVKTLVDASQTAGVWPVDISALGADMVAFAGHKGLMGPPGTGVLWVGEGIDLAPLVEGGTGSFSESTEQPPGLPDRYEGGTPNTVGLAGLAAAIEYLNQMGMSNIREHERDLIGYFLLRLQEIPGVRVYGPGDPDRQVAVVSINIGQASSSEVAYMLDRACQVAVRGGFHCAPLAHQSLGTTGQGTVRFSFSIFNTRQEIDHAVDGLRVLAAGM